MLASIAINLTFLGTFKYVGFFVAEAAEVLNLLGFQANVRVLQIVLPVGISFYTFQSLGYVIDVYRGKHPPTRNLLNYALYVAFFPQLVAGPIERAAHMMPQYGRERTFSRAKLRVGLAAHDLGPIQESRDRRQPGTVCRRRLWRSVRIQLARRF